MSPYARRMIAGGVAVGAVALTGWLTHPAPMPGPARAFSSAPATSNTPPAPSARCTRTMPGGWRCTFPTPGRSAVVLVSAWEDGSARAVAIDPDQSGYAPGSEQEKIR